MKVLNTEHARMVSEIVIDALDAEGYEEAEENIPGLVQAIRMYADSMVANEGLQALDEAVDLLVEGEDF